MVESSKMSKAVKTLQTPKTHEIAKRSKTIKTAKKWIMLVKTPSSGKLPNDQSCQNVQKDVKFGLNCQKHQKIHTC